MGSAKSGPLSKEKQDNLNLQSKYFTVRTGMIEDFCVVSFCPFDERIGNELVEILKQRSDREGLRCQNLSGLGPNSKVYPRINLIWRFATSVSIEKIQAIQMDLQKVMDQHHKKIVK